MKRLTRRDTINRGFVVSWLLTALMWLVPASTYSQVTPTDAVSRQVSAFVTDSVPGVVTPTDAVSRQVSAFVTDSVPGVVTPTDAVSREVSAFVTDSVPGVVAATDAVSRQVSVYILAAHPDLSICVAGSTSYIGEGIINYTAQGQTESCVLTRGQTVVYNIQVCNAGYAAASLLLTGSGNIDDWTIKYFDALTGGNDITGSITGAGWTSPALAPSATTFIRAELTLSGSGNNMSADEFRIIASATSVRQYDVVAIDATPKSGHLWMSFEGSRDIRVSTDAVCWIDYGNDGNDDLPAPLINISSVEGNAVLRLTPQEPYIPGPLQIMGLGPVQPVTTLQPGASMRVPFYYLCPLTGGVHFNLSEVIADDTPVDWAAMEQALQPSDIDPAALEVIWGNLQQQQGPDWCNFVQALRSDAQYLADNGEICQDGRELNMVEVQKASDGFSPQSVLAAAADTFPELSNSGLTLYRLAPAGIAQRFRLGPFGRGWWHGYEYFITYPNANEIQMNGPGGSERVFSNYAGGAWVDSLGGYGQLTQLANGAIQIREKNGVVWLFNASGQLASLTDPNNNQLSFAYTGAFLTTITNSLGQTLALSYDSNGRVTQLTDGAGKVITYQYDASDQFLTGVQYTDGTSLGYSYTPATGAPTDYAIETLTLADGTHLYYSYDEEGCLSGRTRDNGLDPVQYGYGDGGTVTMTDAMTDTATLYFGAYGEVLRSIDPEGNTTTRTINEEGNLTQIVTPDNSISNFSYDTNGNLIGMIDPLKQTAQLGYTTTFSQLSWLTDGSDHQRNFAYDSQSNLTNLTYPNGKSESYGYDSTGDLTSMKNRAGNTTNITYDSAKRPSHIAYPSGRTRDYSYDADNNLLSVTDSVAGAVSMQYDANDRQTRIDYPNGRWFTFTYDAAGRRLNRTGQDGFQLNYQYDNIGRISSLNDVNGNTFIQYSYDAVGRLSTETKGNGTSTSYTYTASGQIKSVMHAGPDGGTLAFYQYTYDANGRPLTVTSQDGVTTYSYDADGQLTGVTTPQGQTIRYAYDASGNRTSVTNNGTVTAYQVNNQMDQYEAVGALNCSYDTNGNLISKSDGLQSWSYTYDECNRLVSFVSPTDAWQYEYDALGNRSAVTHNGLRTEYIVDPIGLGNVAEEVDDASGAITHDIHGLGLSERIDGSGNQYFYNFDGLGNTIQLTDSSGAVANAYQYLPYGECTVLTSNVANPFDYNAALGVMDDGSGLNYMRARFYETDLGRFVTPDPININGGLNIYAYCLNNPLVLSDPIGLGGDQRAKNAFDFTMGSLAIIASFIPGEGEVSLIGMTINGIGIGFNLYNTSKAWIELSNPSLAPIWEKSDNNLNIQNVDFVQNIVGMLYGIYSKEWAGVFIALSQSAGDYSYGSK